MKQCKLLILPTLLAQIYGLGSQSVIVNEPYENAVWIKGVSCKATTMIGWTLDPRVIRRLRDTAFFKYDIELREPNGRLVSQIATGVPGFNYCWNIPESLPEGDYKIKVLTPNRLLVGESNVFKIVER
jgi:hypothetical protein